MQANLKSLARVFISITLIFFLFWFMRDEFDQVQKALKNINMGVFAYSILVFNAAVVVLVLRFKRILFTQGIDAGFTRLLSLTYIAYFFNNFLPTSMGGDLVKGYYIIKQNNKKLQVFTAIFIDRFVGAVTFFAIAAIALITLGIVGKASQEAGLTALVWTMVSATAFICFFFLNKRFARKFKFMIHPFKNTKLEEGLRKIYTTINNVKDHRKSMKEIFALSLVSQLLSFYIVYCLAMSVNVKISFIWVLLLMPIVSAFSMLPSLGGLGVREGATVVFFGPLIGKDNAFIISILWLLLLFIASVAGGLIYLLGKHYRSSFKTKEEFA